MEGPYFYYPSIVQAAQLKFSSGRWGLIPRNTIKASIYRGCLYVLVVDMGIMGCGYGTQVLKFEWLRATDPSTMLVVYMLKRPEKPPRMTMGIHVSCI